MGRSIERIETPAGDPAWHVVGYSAVKTLLADQRIGRGHPEPHKAARYSSDQFAGRPATSSGDEYAEHAWWRKAMNKVFSPGALERLTPTVRSCATRTADDLAALPGAADLKASYSVPLASRVMCGVLGVPAEDVSRFQQWTEEGAQTADTDRSMQGMKRLMAYAAELTRKRRGMPGDDPVSVLVGVEDSKQHLGRVVKLLAGMLAFGRETPASVIDRGVVLLLTHPDQRERLQQDLSRVPRAVEEILRLFKPHAATEDGLLRYAGTDVTLGEVTLRAGDMVLLDVMAANRDPEIFPDPERFDVGREPNPHLTFGYGSYMCNFTKLGRTEISIGVATLLERFPTLRLAEQPDRLRRKEHLRTGGLERLPVAW